MVIIVSYLVLSLGTRTLNWVEPKIEGWEAYILPGGSLERWVIGSDGTRGQLYSAACGF